MLLLLLLTSVFASEHKLQVKQDSFYFILPRIQIFRDCMLRQTRRHQRAFCVSLAKNGDLPRTDALLSSKITHYHNHPIVNADSIRSNLKICQRPCQRTELMISRKDLAEILSINHHSINPKEQVDIGQCSGNCRHHSSMYTVSWNELHPYLTLFQSDNKTCLPTTYSPITFNKRTRPLNNIIINSCSCSSIFLC